MKGKTIVLVGGSSGIGQAVLNRLSGEGAKVLHFSRTEASPQALAGVSHTVFDAVADEFPASWITGQVIGADGGMGTIRLFR